MALWLVWLFDEPEAVPETTNDVPLVKTEHQRSLTCFEDDAAMSWPRFNVEILFLCFSTMPISHLPFWIALRLPEAFSF